MGFCKSCGEIFHGGVRCASCGAESDGRTYNPVSGEEVANISRHVQDKYLPSGLSTADNVEESMRRMVMNDSTPVVTHKSCCLCAKKVAVADIHARAGRPYCFDCYNNEETCGLCSAPVTGVYITIEGKKFHKHCYDAQNSQCLSCRQNVDQDSGVTAFGRRWHYKCFLCARCGIRLDENNVTQTKDTLFCSDCSANTKHILSNVRRAEAQAKAAEEYEEKAKNVIKSRETIQKGKEVCAGCNRILDGDSIMALENLWHPECFKCAWCAKPFIGKDVCVRRGGKPYHGNCVREAFPELNCGACGKSMSGTRMVTLDGQKMHFTCFRCSECNGTMEGGYTIRGTKPVCAGCVSRNPVTTTTTTSQAVSDAPHKAVDVRNYNWAKSHPLNNPKSAQGGFTVDQQTGQRKFFNDAAEAKFNAQQMEVGASSGPSISIPSATAPATPSGPPTNRSEAPYETNDLDYLEKLAKLKQQGIITEEEFTAKKREILGL